jgi:hypothetical protein
VAEPSRAFEVGVLELTIVFGTILAAGLLLAVLGGSVAFIHRASWAAGLAWLGLALVAVVWWLAT